MPSQPRELKASEISTVAAILSKAASTNEINLEEFRENCNIPAGHYPENQAFFVGWLATVRDAHAGSFITAGGGLLADAVVWLVEKLASSVKNSSDTKLLARLSYTLGAGRALPAVPQPQIFLSYSWGDRDDVNSLYDALLGTNTPGLEVFQDYRSIRLGQNWHQTIRNAARDASVLACWVTPKFLTGPFCNYEVGIAEQAGAAIVPIWIAPSDVKTAPIFLSGRQGIRVNDPNDPNNPVNFRSIADDLLALV